MTAVAIAVANYPATIKEFLTFLPDRPPLHPRARYSSSTEIYTAQITAPPADRSISCQPRPCPHPKTEKKIIGRVVTDLGVGAVSCQSMQRDVQNMVTQAMWTEAD
ncbi:uncharacterized protein BT62DRAFT_933136 [Guyanagaster necrorhizus]|uniref:Uncharacterized protein n=1 Tax=Guyanagaster necrorhizus TaxID=856835 RepID=A0A9P8ARN3_9AGAR|nr:uncharacterized protein BT62DRAFT_933136 [Guyanagaster necrorhizus MCA 3950]KAG7445295.1 hypothetical protein BT62DRAFT_933136 [Guyanagaster necrorhizus MCA 3950]